MWTFYTYFYRSGTNTPDSGGDWRYRFVFEVTSQSQSANTSNLRIYHYLELRNQPSGAQYRVWYAGNSIDGSSYSLGFREGISTPSGNSSFLIYTQNRTITHNSDGSKSLNVSARGGWGELVFGGMSYAWVYTALNTISLPTIPRLPSYNSINASNITLNSVRLTASIDTKGLSITAGGWDLSTNGGLTWTYYDGGVTDKTITGLIPGTQYWYRGYVVTIGGSVNSWWGTFTTTQQATITNSNVNFDVDNGITINFSNPSGKQVDLYLNLADLTIITLRENITSPYVLNLTEDEKNTIFNSSPNSNSLGIIVGLMTDETYYSSKNGTASITNANPTFSNFTYEDINETTVDLTGDNQKIIKGYSNLKATVSTTNKAVANKGATMSKYQLVVGSKQTNANYSNDEDVELTLNSIDNNVFLLYAIDSRNNSTVVQKSPTDFIDYFKPTITSATATRENNISTDTRLHFEGTFFNENFGSQNNTLTATYKYKKSDDEEWTEVEELELEIDGNTFSFDGLIKGDLGANGFDIANSYYISITINDKLDNVKKEDIVLISATPNMAMSKKGTAFNGFYDDELGGALQVNGGKVLNILEIYPIGSIYMSVNSTNPGTLFGGTWEEFGKGRTLVGVDTSQTEFNSVEKIGGAKTHTLTIDEMPNHNHNGGELDNAIGTRLWGTGVDRYMIGTGAGYQIGIMVSKGGNQPHNNLQPYITVYMWKRVA